MKILVISGFLGAGKTTFIKALAKHTGRSFAILENEYGSVGIDGDTLKKEMPAENANIWEMAEGCICCSMKGDFAASVLTIANTVDPDYLVIEPTGVAALSQLIQNLQQIEYERITLLAPVTVVDGHSYRRYIKEYTELYRNQIASAHTVVVSKMERADAKEKAYLKAELEAINPDGKILTEHYSSLSREEWISLLEHSYKGEELKAEIEAVQELPDTFSIRNASMERPERLFLMLEQLIRGAYGNIFRAKGQISAGEQSFRFDVADGQYSITGGDDDGADKAVFIGTEIQRQKIRQSFLLQTRKIILPKKRKELSGTRQL